jgi:hypothetical protein
MKRVLIVLVVCLAILFLTKLIKDVPQEPKAGYSFVLMGQKVISCSTQEIVLANTNNESNHLDKDDSWPDCSVFSGDELYDFYLNRGEHTHFDHYEKTVWWRKVIK